MAQAERPSYRPEDGLIAALPMPFKLTEAGEHVRLDTENLENHVRFLEDSQVIQAYFLYSTTGDGETMAAREDYKMMEQIAETVGDKKPILAGITAHNLEATLRVAEFADKFADALVLAPSKLEEDQRKIIEEVIQKTTKPIVLYNPPGQINTALDLEVVKALMQKNPSRIVGLKESSDLTRWAYKKQAMALQREGETFYLEGNGPIMAASADAGTRASSSRWNGIAPTLVHGVLTSRPGEERSLAMARLTQDAGSVSTIPQVKERLVEMKVYKPDAMPKVPYRKRQAP